MASGLTTGPKAHYSTAGMDNLNATPTSALTRAKGTARHVVSVQDVTKDSLMNLIERSERLRTLSRLDAQKRLQGALVATLFYEPSTRTRMSFEAAILRLGGNVVGAENALENSSAKKGETLADVFRVLGSYVDAIVIRHHETDAVAHAAHYSPVPVISAGTGAGEHPTQALLDVYTIWRELGRIDDLSVTIAGDLKYGRTVHSLLRMLSWFKGIEVTMFSPEHLTLPEEMRSELAASGMKLSQGADFHASLARTDVLYQTRVQAERFQGESGANRSSYVVGAKELSCLPAHARILHPLPRVDEIDSAIDDDPRAAYFRQVENGLYMRMALLEDLLGGVDLATSH